MKLQNLTKVREISIFLIDCFHFCTDFRGEKFLLKIKENCFFIFLGNISYSLYLSHLFVDATFMFFKKNAYFYLPHFIFKIIVCIFAATFLSYFVEKKITEYLQIKLKA